MCMLTSAVALWVSLQAMMSKSLVRIPVGDILLSPCLKLSKESVESLMPGSSFTVVVVMFNDDLV
jgi:hypothetical protein